MVSTEKTSIAWIGRFTGPKGELAKKMLTDVVPNFPGLKFTFVGGPVNQAIENLAPVNVDFTGFVDNVSVIINSHDLIIGAGRVVLEAMQAGKPVIAVGESAYIGLINDSTIEQGKATNFGDCASGSEFNIKQLIKDIQAFVANKNDLNAGKYPEYLEEYDSKKVHQDVMSVYKQAIVDRFLTRFKELPILMYHRVVSEKPHDSKFNIYVTTQELEFQLINLKQRGFTSTTFKELYSGCQPKKPILLTFDDGYKDNYDNLLPLLKKHKMKATIFVVGDRNLLTNKWDAELGESSFPLMNNEQIKECHQSGLIEIASHGLQHKHYPNLTDDELSIELTQSKQNIEALINDSVVTFAYPYGDYSEREAQAVQAAGYVFGVGTVNGPLTISDDYYKVRRINMFSNTSAFKFWQKTTGYYLRYCKMKGKDF